MAEQALGGAAQTGLAGLGTTANYLGAAGVFDGKGGQGTIGQTGGITADDYQQFLRWKQMQGAAQGNKGTLYNGQPNFG